MLKSIRVRTTDGDEDRDCDSPYRIGVYQFRNLYLIESLKGQLPEELKGSYTDIGKAKHAILLYWRKKEFERNFKPSGRPRLKFRSKRGVKVGDKRGPYKVKNNGTSKASSSD